MTDLRTADLVVVSIVVASLLAGQAVAQEAPAGKDPIPAWLIRAREAMQVRGTYGLVFVVPGAERPLDELERRALRQRGTRASARLHERIRACAVAHGKPVGMDMWYIGYDAPREVCAVEVQTLLMTERTDVKELLLECVLLCASAEQAGAEPGETVVLIDPFGRRVDGAKVDIGDEDAFAKAVAKLLHAEGRLEWRVERARSPRVAEALENLAAPEERDAARARLLEGFEAHAAAVVAARREHGGAARKKALDGIVDEAYERAAGAERTGLLPFGASWVERKGDPCPPCGMSRMPQPSRKFLSILAK